MISNSLIVVSVALGIAGTAFWLIRRGVTYRQERRFAAARGQFSRRREWLEAEFMKVASLTGRPRGLEWVDGDFANGVAFARDRRSGSLTALVGVAIKFEAIEGGGMEDVEAVDDRKAATAVFRHDNHKWTTDGRAIFNLNPEEAIEYYHGELEVVD